MKGLVKYALGVGNLELREVPETAPAAGEVKIAVKAAGICGTDLHIYEGEYPCRPPVILGHECAGEIVEIGADVTGIQVGDRVTALPFAVTCGHCRYCRQGLPALCAQRRSFGSGVNGAFASYLTIPAHIVRHLPENIPYDCGALTEPLACCVRAVNELLDVQAGDVALVTGPGAIGLLALQVVQARGATAIVIGSDGDEQRLAVAQGLGAALTLRAGVDDIESAVRDWTGGGGADLLVECSGAPAAVRTTLGLLRPRAQISQMGLFGRSFELDYDQIVFKELRVIGSFASSVTAWDRALMLLQSGAVQIEPIISNRLPLDEWERAFRIARQREGLKVLFDPTP
jgi:L-iditol 2-dehydrogenase